MLIGRGDTRSRVIVESGRERVRNDLIREGERQIEHEVVKRRKREEEEEEREREREIERERRSGIERENE